MKTWPSGLLLLAACGASQPPSPYYGDEQYLVLGVRPDAEAIALVQQLALAGFPLVRRVDGKNFTALGFSDPQGSPIEVRVVTARGIALALDSTQSDPFHEGVRYSLLESPYKDTADADGDGFEEVFVEEQRSSGDPPCVRPYRVRDSGFIDPVEDSNYSLSRTPDSEADAWREPNFCASEKPPEGSETTPDAGAPSTPAAP